MRHDGGEHGVKWGEFFSASLSPHAYNETVAQEYLPLKKNAAIAKGYKWKEDDAREYQKSNYEIPDKIEEVEDGISDEILACSECHKNYRIIKQELKFYKEQKMPIPRLCPECRHARRNSLRNPRELFARECTKCATEVKSSFSPSRIEKVYCEKDYLEAVY